MSGIYKDKNYGLGELRKVVDTAMQKLIVEYDKNTKELNDEVVKIFDAVQSDVEFKKAFIYESLSGKKNYDPTDTHDSTGSRGFHSYLAEAWKVKDKLLLETGRMSDHSFCYLLYPERYSKI